MSLIQISPVGRLKEASFMEDAFRPFFLFALVHSMLTILWWFFAYQGSFLDGSSIRSSVQIHAHEMVYGYTMAVIAGFLLTAVPQWIGKNNFKKQQIAVLLVLWSLSRIFILCGARCYWLAAFADIAFFGNLGLLLAVPLFRGKHWKQMGILSKVILLALGNLLFYTTSDSYWVQFSLQGGLFLEIGLVLTIAGRVFPGFIENGMSEYRPIRNPRSLSVLILVSYLIFCMNRFIWMIPWLHTLSAASAFLGILFRLWLWHSTEIWKNPLLWSLYLSMMGVAIGFLIFAIETFFPSSAYLGIHALALGGIAFATVGMMGRVILGHSRGDVHKPPAGLKLGFLCLGSAFLVRVLFPFFIPTSHFLLMQTAQILWLLAFGTFAVVYTRLLVPKSFSLLKKAMARSTY